MKKYLKLNFIFFLIIVMCVGCMTTSNPSGPSNPKSDEKDDTDIKSDKNDDLEIKSDITDFQVTNAVPITIRKFVTNESKFEKKKLKNKPSSLVTMIVSKKFKTLSELHSELNDILTNLSTNVSIDNFYLIASKNPYDIDSFYDKWDPDKDIFWEKLNDDFRVDKRTVMTYCFYDYQMTEGEVQLRKFSKSILNYRYNNLFLFIIKSPLLGVLKFDKAKENYDLDFLKKKALEAKESHKRKYNILTGNIRVFINFKRHNQPYHFAQGALFAFPHNFPLSDKKLKEFILESDTVEISFYEEYD